MRGRRAAGYGMTAGHRASGQRGGKGNAGSKKHHYIRTMLENPRYFGKWGFKRPQKLLEEQVVVNVGELDETVDKLVTKGLATKSGRIYTIDMSVLGIDKVLGAGKVTHKLNLVGVKSISSKGREKVCGKGGTIDLPAE